MKSTSIGIAARPESASTTRSAFAAVPPNLPSAGWTAAIGDLERGVPRQGGLAGVVRSCACIDFAVRPVIVVDWFLPSANATAMTGQIGIRACPTVPTRRSATSTAVSQMEIK